MFLHLKRKKRKKVGLFLDTVKSRSFKLCMVITLLGIYQFIPGLMTLTLFQGQRFGRIIKCKLLFLYIDFVHRSLNVVWFLPTLKRSGTE